MKHFNVTVAILVFCLSASRAEDLASEVLAEVNLARTQPGRYAEFVAESAAASRGSRAAREAVRFLRNAQPRTPLAWSDGISRAALAHVLDTGIRGRRGHYGSRGESPWKRMARFGQWTGSAAENISYGLRDARAIVVSLIIDEGVPGRGHRQNLFGNGFRVAGVATGAHVRYGTMCVMDFAGGFVEAIERRIAAVQTR
jgi:uncharacterized protein YkwD